ncbi:MAG: Response regulator receiver protein [uncultured bacterium]|nr:MAG: Response regulator receiver protein [uncultured bacterium]
MTRVLIVEDDPLLAKMYKTKFVSEGFDVTTAEDGEVGLKSALEARPDFMILDIMMPRLSGIELLKKLRQSTGGVDIPVIVLSNLSEKKEMEEAKNLGVKEFLIKSNLTPKDIVEKVRGYLRESQLDRPQ